jgi:hypothetical protein
MPDDLRERLADLCHSQWSNWMKYLFTKGEFNDDGSFTIDFESVLRWLRQSEMPYRDLSESEQESDRKEADKFLKVFNDQS